MAILSLLRILAIILVIVGAFFKIEHLGGANIILSAGVVAALVWLLGYGIKNFGNK